METKAIKDVVTFAVAIAEVADAAADGVSFGDILQAVGALKKLQPALLAVQSGKVLEQYRALDDAAKTELSTWFNEELDLTNDEVEGVVEKAFEVVLSLNDLLKLVKE